MLSTLGEDTTRPGAFRGEYDPLGRAPTDSIGIHNQASTTGMVLDPALQNTDPTFTVDPPQGSGGMMNAQTTRESSTTSNMFGGNELQNPSDALGILAQIASNSNGDNSHSYGMMTHPMKEYQHSSNYGQNSLDYPLVRDGRLSVSKVIQLL